MTRAENFANQAVKAGLVLEVNKEEIERYFLRYMEQLLIQWRNDLQNKELVGVTDITRVEVIDEKGRSYVNWNNKNEVTMSIQDQGKTMKIFINVKR